MKARTIQVSDNGDGTVTIDILGTDDQVMADGCFEGKNARTKAEARAEKLSKMCKCDWQTNY